LSKVGIDSPATVDVVAVHRDTRDWLLGIDQNRPWLDSDRDVHALRKKIQAYVSFAKDGQLVTQYPEAEGHGVVIRIHCETPPPRRIELLLDSVRTWLRAQGIGLEVRVRRRDRGVG